MGIIPLEREGSPFVQVRGDRAGCGWGNHSSGEGEVTLCTGERGQGGGNRSPGEDGFTLCTGERNVTMI